MAFFRRREHLSALFAPCLSDCRPLWSSLHRCFLADALDASQRHRALRRGQTDCGERGHTVTAGPVARGTWLRARRISRLASPVTSNGWLAVSIEALPLVPECEARREEFCEYV